MSRTYKKYPVWRNNDRGGSKFGKRVANKKVRKTKDLFNGGSYKKLSESYDIIDCIYVEFEWNRKRPYDYWIYDPQTGRRVWGTNKKYAWWKGYNK